jgi:hypothetical protein
MKCDSYSSFAFSRRSMTYHITSSYLPREVIKVLLIIYQECLQGWLDDVGGGDVGVILRTDHLEADF